MTLEGILDSIRCPKAFLIKAKTYEISEDIETCFFCNNFRKISPHQFKFSLSWASKYFLFYRFCEDCNIYQLTYDVHYTNWGGGWLSPCYQNFYCGFALPWWKKHGCESKNLSFFVQYSEYINTYFDLPSHIDLPWNELSEITQELAARMIQQVWKDYFICQLLQQHHKVPREVSKERICTFLYSYKN